MRTNVFIISVRENSPGVRLVPPSIPVVTRYEKNTLVSGDVGEPANLPRDRILCAHRRVPEFDRRLTFSRPCGCEKGECGGYQCGAL